MSSTRRIPASSSGKGNRAKAKVTTEWERGEAAQTKVFLLGAGAQRYKRKLVNQKSELSIWHVLPV
jgi:hypothetical protein